MIVIIMIIFSFPFLSFQNPRMEKNCLNLTKYWNQRRRKKNWRMKNLRKKRRKAPKQLFISSSTRLLAFSVPVPLIPPSPFSAAPPFASSPPRHAFPLPFASVLLLPFTFAIPSNAFLFPVLFAFPFPSLFPFLFAFPFPSLFPVLFAFPFPSLFPFPVLFCVCFGCVNDCDGVFFNATQNVSFTALYFYCPIEEYFHPLAPCLSFAPLLLFYE